MYNAPEQNILILGSALPSVAEAALRSLCRSWEALLAPWLTPQQLCHIRRFAPEGAALSARASRLLARLLLLRGLQILQGPSRTGLRLDRDAWGRPLLPGWRVGFSHSGQAAFCALWAERGRSKLHERKKERTGSGHHVCSDAVWHTGLGLDAETLDTPPPAARAFAEERGGAVSARDALRRWTVKEAALKAIRPWFRAAATGSARACCASGARACAGGFWPAPRTGFVWHMARRKRIRQSACAG